MAGEVPPKRKVPSEPVKDAHRDQIPGHPKEPPWQERALRGSQTTPAIRLGFIPVCGVTGSSGEGLAGLPSPDVA